MIRHGHIPAQAAAIVGIAVSLAISGCGGPEFEIVRVSRQNNSGTYAYFREAIVGPDGELKLGSLDLSGSKDVVEMVATTPNAIGFSGMGYGTRHVKMLKLRHDDQPGYFPTAQSVAEGKYPLARPLYVYVVGKPTGPIKHFLHWILSEEGQSIVELLGYVRAPSPAHIDDVRPATGTITIGGSDTMVNLAQAWAESYSQAFPQVRPEVSGGGTGVGIAKLIEGTVQIANASREMKDEERRQILANHGQTVEEYVVGMDAIAVFVHPSNPVKTLRIQDLAQIFGEGGTIHNWQQVDGWSHPTIR